MAGRHITGRDARQLGELLDSSEVLDLIDELERTRWTGRRGYPIRTMVGMALAKSLYVLPTWTRTVTLSGTIAPFVVRLGAHGGAMCRRWTRATGSPASRGNTGCCSTPAS